MQGKGSGHAQLRDTPGLHWHRAPGQSQVLGQENWQSGFGLTWLNDTLTSPHKNHPHLKGKQWGMPVIPKQ